MATILFWAATLLLLHTYFFYPLVLVLWDGVSQALSNARRLVGAGEPPPDDSTAELPTVSVVVSAYNEEQCISQKIANSLDLRYPADRLEVILGLDGCTDATETLARRCKDARVKVSSGPRSGKAAVLNRCVPSATGEIVVLSDANTVIAPDALEKLVRPFADLSVGAVCGRLRLYNPTLQHYEESAYWAYESLLKLYEGRRGAVMGANGGLYAIRRSLFEALPDGTIVDDFVIPLRILDRGYQIRYEPEALACEETTEDYGREFARRTRIAAGNFQSLELLAGLLSPLRGFRAFAFWSHKVLRWCAPALMAVAFASNAAIARAPLYLATFAAQVCFYALALSSRVAWPRGGLARAASAAYYFVTMNAAIALGFWRFLRHSQGAAWERTAR